MTNQTSETQAKWNRVVAAAETLTPYASDDGGVAWSEARSKAWAGACEAERLRAEGRHSEAGAVLFANFTGIGQRAQ